MLNTLLGQKKNMSQAFVGDTRVPVTYVKTDPCVVTQIKNVENDGYWAIQLGFGTKPSDKLTKPMQGHLKGATKKKVAPRFLREVRVKDKPDFKVGDEVKITDVFNKGDIVQVTGVSKGKGFQGVVKRWNFKGGPATHGQKDTQRSPGSIGQGTDPGRVWKGKKMAGRMGNQTTTIKNLTIVDIDEDENVIALSGPVPGVPGNPLVVEKIASGKLEELEEEAPEVKEQEVPPEALEEEGEGQEAGQSAKKDGAEEKESGDKKESGDQEGEDK